jgi:hypothetical protein
MHVKRIMANPEPKNMLVSRQKSPSVASAMGPRRCCGDHNNHELTTREGRIEVVALVGNFTALVSDRVAILEKLFIDGDHQ